MSENTKPHTDLNTSSSSSQNDQLSLDTSVMQAAEARMRRALGLDGGTPKPRMPERSEPAPRPAADRFNQGHKRRFVQDGEVPVTVVTGRRDGVTDLASHRNPVGSPAPSRLGAAEAALAQETAARHHAERALTEANAVIHDLQTKLGHAELARDEATNKLHAEQENAASLRAELRECQERLAAAEAARVAAERSSRQATRPVVVDADDDSSPAPAPRRAHAAQRKPQKKPGGRSKLVRWWVKEEAAAE